MHRDSLTVRALEFYGTKIRHKGQWRIHPWLRRLFGINLNAEFYVTRSGLVWRLNPNNYVESDLFWLDLKDPWEIHNIKNLIAPGSIIFDIGANFGYYSCMIAKMLSGCKIYAFEPLAYNFERLKTNISLNNMEGCVQVHKLGMSDSEGTATMSLNIKNSGAAHIISNGGDIIITTIDNFCKSKKVEKIDFIKIDVEGYELFVLRGGENIIRKSKPVLLIEINPPTLKRIGLKPRDVIDRLKYHGYNLYVPNRKKLTKLNNLPGTENYIINVFCLPDHISLRLT